MHFSLVPVLAASVLFTSGLAHAQDVFGIDDADLATTAPLADTEVLVPFSAAAGQVTRLPGFDPVRDVPFMKNWKGDIDNSGAGVCYALSVLTTYFYQKVEFVPEDTGVSLDEWDRDFDKVLRIDDESLEEIPHLLARSLKDVENDGKLKLGGVADLREFTAITPLSEEMRADLEELSGVEAVRAEHKLTDKTNTVQAFRRWAEAVQFFMQVDGSGLNYVGGIAKSRLGWVPLMPWGPDEVNKDGLNIIRDRLKEGRPAIVSLHDDGLKLKGHVVVVYELQETETEARLTTYDCNRPPTSETEARPTVVTLQKNGGWDYEALRSGSSKPAYQYRIFTVVSPDSRKSRRFFEANAGNDEEALQRSRHLGNLVGADRSLKQRIGGAAGFVGEVLNPF